MSFDQSTIDAFSALGLGFAFAGLLMSLFELVARKPLGFGLLHIGGLRAIASVPVLVFSAPLLILRNTVRGRRIERRPIPYVMLATVLAGFWGIMCGRLVLDVANLFTGA